MASEQAFLQAHRYQLDVDVRGDGPALLLAHGAGGGIEGNFGLVLDDLGRDHTTIGPSYPGVGRTPLPDAPLDLDALADAVVASAVDRGHERFAVIGESLGSAVAVRAATRHPERVTALVLTAGFAAPDPVLGGAGHLLAALGKAGEWRGVARLALLSCLSERQLTAMSPADVEAAVDGVVAAIPAGTLAHFELIMRLDVRDDLGHVRVPTLVAVPTGDRLVLPDSQRRLAAGIPGATMVEIPGGGHVLDEADRAVWLGHVRRFLAEAGV
ncbi:alpha/beta fold hydrolase [Streptomyces sp. NPDC059008]|uniref:alpha/beta fold hydrolase n=1 Tax=Streptomyces sp. NPDC059008 TaxID=3346693 RepID=UPI0036D0D640